MDLLIALDAWFILRVFEPLAWRIEYRYGHNCFSLSRGTFTLAMMSFTAGWLLSAPILLYLLTPMLALAWMMSFTITIAVEHIVVTRPNRINPFKSLWFVRHTLTLVGISLIVQDVSNGHWYLAGGDTIGILGVISSMYLMTCNPMPPKWEPPQRELEVTALPAPAGL